MSGAPHQRPAAEPRDLVEENLARLDIGDDGAPRMGGEHVGGEQDHELVAPQNPPPSVHHADAVAVAIERDAEVATLAPHRLLKLDQVLGHRGIGVVGRERAVDLLVQHDVAAGKPRAQHLHRAARRPVAGIPGHLEGPFAAVICGELLDIAIEHPIVFEAALAGGIVAGGGDLPEVSDVGAEEGRRPQHELETVVVGRIVRARDHDAAVGAARMHGVIKHRRRPEADAADGEPAPGQPVGDRGGECGRAQPAVIAEADLPAPASPDHRAEGAPDGQRIRRAQGLADDAANVVFAQHRGVETMAAHELGPLGWY